MLLRLRVYSYRQRENKHSNRPQRNMMRSAAEENQILSLQAENQKLVKKIRNLEDSVDFFKSECEANIEKAAELSEIIQKREQGGVEKELLSKNIQNAELVANVDALTMQLELAEKCMRQLGKERDTNMSMMKALSKTLLRSDSTTDDLKEVSFEWINGNVASLVADRNKLDSKCKSLEADVLDKVDQIQTLESQFHVMNLERNEEETKVTLLEFDTIKEELKVANEENDELMTYCQNTLDKMKDIEKELKEVKLELASTLEELGSVKEERKKLEANVQDTFSNYKNYQTQYRHAQTEIAKLQENREIDLEISKAKEDELNERLSISQHDYKKLYKQYDSALSKVRKLEAESILNVDIERTDDLASSYRLAQKKIAILEERLESAQKLSDTKKFKADGKQEYADVVAKCLELQEEASALRLKLATAEKNELIAKKEAQRCK